MNPCGDKLATTQQPAHSTASAACREPKRKGKGKPVAVVGYGSAKVPVYRCASGGRVRFAISYHRDGRRLRQFFGDLTTAKKEALLVAQRIQSGMQHMTDLKPHDRENYLAARARLDGPGVPLVVAVEDYVQCRDMLKGIPLRQAVEDFIRRTHRVKLGVKVPQAVTELLETKGKDGMSGRPGGLAEIASAQMVDGASFFQQVTQNHTAPILHAKHPGCADRFPALLPSPLP
jgi:hypothetical protein